MISKDRNFTRYNTEDLNIILDTFHNWNCCFSYTDWNNRPMMARLNTDVSDIECVKTAPVDMRLTEPYRGRKRTCVGSGIIGVSRSTLSIRSPRGLMKGDLTLAMVAAEASGEMPSAVIVEIFLNLYAHFNNRRTEDFNTKGSQKLKEFVEENVPKLRLRLEKKSEAGSSRNPPLTKEQKIERLLSDSFYGQGGELRGPFWGYKTSRRAATGQWLSRIRDAACYYKTERDAREVHAEKLRTLGHEPEPYETFSDFLRRVADEYDQHGHVKVYR